MHARRRIYARTHTLKCRPLADLHSFGNYVAFTCGNWRGALLFALTTFLSLSLSFPMRYNTRRCHRNASRNARVTRALRDAFDERLHRMPPSSSPSPRPPVSGRRAEMRQSRTIIVGLWISDIP